MQKLYLNTVDRTWYDADGSQPSDSNPQIPLGNSERIIIQCCSETPDAGTPGIDPETDWTKDTQFNLTGVSALLSADNNFLRHLKGQLKTALESGTVSSVELTITGATAGKIPSTGAVRLFDASGNFESLEYTSRAISGTTVTFTTASGSTLQNSYAVGTTADCPESLYAQAAMNGEESDPATGLFVFDIVMDSQKLREASDYSDISEISDIKGLELLVFTVDDDVITVKNAYLCTTFRIPVPMALPDQNPEMPETYQSNVAAMTSALLAAGFELQFSADDTSWHDTQTSSDLYYRFRSASAGGDWTSAITLIQGPAGQDGADGQDGAPGQDGTDGITPHIDSTSKHWMIGETDTGVVAEGQDGTDGVSPHIGANGDWYLGDTDTGVKAEISGSYIEFSAVDASGNYTLAGTTTVPYAVLTNAGNFYPVEKGSVTVNTSLNTVSVNVAPYLAYDNAASFSGTWRLYFAAGNIQPGDEIVTLTGTAITPQDGAVYRKTLAASDAFTIDTSGLTADKKLAFELWVIQPSTAVSFTLPNTIMWGDGYDFDWSYPPPTMTTANKLYCIVIRWDGSDLLGNLAYQKTIQVSA